MADRSRDEAKRQQIQTAVDSIKAGRGTDRDFNVISNRDLMYFATGDQCCDILEAAKKHTLPAAVVWAAADTLRVRWLQSPHRRSRNGGGAPRRPNGDRGFRPPAGWTID